MNYKGNNDSTRSLYVEEASSETEVHSIKIKALTWRIYCAKSRNCEAITSFGKYTIEKVNGLFRLWHLGSSDYDYSGKYTNLNDAKAAAQADFTRRVMLCLERNPNEVTAHKVRDQFGNVFAICTNKSDAIKISCTLDLLEALKDARHMLYGNGPGNPKIDAAINKAEMTHS